MKEKYNFKIDHLNSSVTIEISSEIFPIPIILHTIYNFIKDTKVIVNGNDKIIIVTFISNQETKKSNLEKLAHEFNTQLIVSFVENIESEKHAGIRNEMTEVDFPDHSSILSEKPQIIKGANIKGRSFIIITRKCINNCLFCTEKNKTHWKELTIEKIKEILDLDCKSFSQIVFSGGEPTLREDLPELIKYAKNLGYHTRLFTNGRLFSNPKFSEKIDKAGLDSVLIPVHSYSAKIHDQITQAPGSFSQTISGIKNLALHNIKVSVKIIPNKINYKNLPKLASFLISLPDIDYIGMDMLTISGNALKNKDIISEKLSTMVPFIEKALDIFFAAEKKVVVGSLPLCLIKSKYWHYIQNDRIKEEINAGTDIDKASVIRYTGESITPICKNCIVKDKCPGTWPSYFRVYGYSELKPINH